MDTLLHEFHNSMNGFMFDHFSTNRNNHHSSFKIDSQPSFQSVNPEQHENNSPSPSATTSSSSSSSSSSWPISEGDNPNTNTVLLKYINDILMEEDIEAKTCMLQDCLALQAAEKSLYDAIGQEYPFHSSICNSSNTDPNMLDQSQKELSPTSTLLGSNFHKETYPFENFVFTAGSSVLAPGTNSSRPPGNQEIENLRNVLWGKKNHERDVDGDYLEEERNNKLSTFSLAESDQSENMFDDVLLCQGHGKESALSSNLEQENRLDEQRKGSNGSRSNSSSRTSRKKNGKKSGVVDLWTLLTQCAQAVSINDQRTATELVKQIRQHSSDSGDGNQRLAHYFANALEIRLAGIRLPKYSPMLSNRTSAADILKAYQVYIKACPFKRMSNFFANRTILKQAEKAKSLHIIDFGILYGFQWPCLIQRLSERPGGPPKLRITGIELPQPGFRPSERVEETGRRLTRYCERFNVPFTFNVIARKWETIRYQDLKIDKDEMIVVNSLYRFKNLPDDTVVVESARDTVLTLIRTIKPDIFIHGVVNGAYNAPFFLTRFREALFHFSSLFDMFEVNVPRHDEQRKMFEKEIYAKDAINVVAFEGAERVERPETYKQWQARNLRAGLRQIPLDQGILKQVRSTVKAEYHKDFVIDQDGQWMLQGWKGRIVHALSVWKPAY